MAFLLGRRSARPLRRAGAFGSRPARVRSRRLKHTTSSPASSPARACAYAVILRVFAEGAWADRALHAEARRLRLDPRERALATRLAYGTVQRKATLDHLIAQWSSRP